MRLDIHITKLYPELTRSQAKRLVEEGHVRVDGVIADKPSRDVKECAVLEVHIPLPEQANAEPQDIPLDVLYEDHDIIVVNKPANMVVHPAAGNPKGTLVNALLYHCKDLSGIGGELRPGIVHRLDKGTSGIMVIAKNDASHLSLSGQFKARSVDKRYYALVYGKLPKDEGHISAPIGRHVSDRKKMSVKTRKGRTAETGYKVIERFGTELTLVDIKIGTGRTHQIRVHFSHIGHPLVGDETYGGPRSIKRLNNDKLRDIVKAFSRPFLHSYKLGFEHPKSGKRMEFTSKMPLDMEGLLDELHNL